MAGAHAVLSASGAHRWLNCPPSAQLEARMPDTSSAFAAEGTLAHRLGELELRMALGTSKPDDYEREAEQIRAHELYSEEMPDYVAQYRDYVLETLAEARVRTPDPLIFLELKLNFGRWVPGGFGTGDVVILADERMEIVDLKYGKGVPVDAEDNPQMKLYALGALEELGFLYDIRQVRMTIYQPRIDNVSSWEIAADELMAWAEDELRPKAQLAWEGKGDAAAGDWCRFCKVKARCRTRAEAVQAMAGAFGLRAPNLLGIDEIAKILNLAEEIQSWAKDVQDFALEQARDHGVKFSGWKLVEGRSNRRYADEDAVEEALVKAKYRKRDIFQEPKLLGISAMEKLLGRKRFAELLDDLVVKPPGQPTLVAESDPRPELSSAAADFDL